MRAARRLLLCGRHTHTGPAQPSSVFAYKKQRQPRWNFPCRVRKMAVIMPSNAAPASANPLFAFASSLWPHIRRWGLPAFAIIVLGLLVSHAHKVDWAGA